MKNMKKWAIIAAAGVVCIVLVFLLVDQFKTPKAGDVINPQDIIADDVNPDRINDVVINPNTDTLPSDADGATSTGTDQTIQPDPVKPTEPSEIQKTNPKTVDHDNVTLSTSSSESKAGDKKDGKIYVPGFGWIEDNGGGGSGTTVGSDGDINKQIGEMD